MGRPAAVRLFGMLMAALFVTSLTKHVLTFATGPTAIIYDAEEYWLRGARALDGDWLLLSDPVDYRTPLYPLFLALMQGLFGEYALMATAVAQHLLQMASSLLIASACYIVSRSRLVALAGYAVAVLCVTRAWYANVTLTGTLFSFFITATVWMLAIYYRRPSMLRLAGVGALLGASTLVRPIPQMLWLPLFAIVFLQDRTLLSLRQKCLHVAAGLCALGVTLSPAIVRNYLTVDHVYVARVPPINKWVVCFNDGSGANLPIPRTPAGNRLLTLVPELASGRPEDRSGYAVIARLQDRGLANREIDELLTAVCMDAVERQPGIFFWQTFKRLGNFWRCAVAEYPYYSSYELDDDSKYYNQKTWRIEPLATWTEAVLSRTLSRSVRWLEIDFIACMIGTVLLIIRPQTRFIGLSLAIMFVYFPTITALLEIESHRYRRVLEPCIVIAIVAGLFGHRDCFSRGDREPRTTPT